MKKRLPTLALALPLLLTSCGAADFESPEQKQAAFDRYLCKEGVESEIIYGYSYATKVIGDSDSYSEEDRSAAFDIMLVDSDVVKNEWEFHKKDPSFKPMTSERLDPLEDGECQGWTWEQYREERASEIEGFTYADAEEAGVLE